MIANQILLYVAFAFIAFAALMIGCGIGLMAYNKFYEAREKRRRNKGKL